MVARSHRESVRVVLDRVIDRLAELVRSGRRVVTALDSERRISGRRSDDVPLCPVYARGRIGPDWAHRTGIARERVAGEVESFDDFAGDGFDPESVPSEIRRFYERTAEYTLTYETTWHRGFRLGAWLASLVTSPLGQLNLPGRSDAGRSDHEPRRLESRLAHVAPGADPRGSRVWTRTDPDTGAAVFVAIYATDEHDGVTYATVAVPLPWANLSTVLRPELISTDTVADTDAPDVGVAFTTWPTAETTPPTAREGLYLVTPLGAIALPMNQTFRVYPADVPAAPRSPTADATLVATHEMWIAGRQFLTIRYGIERSVP